MSTLGNVLCLLGLVFLAGTYGVLGFYVLPQLDPTTLGILGAAAVLIPAGTLTIAKRRGVGPRAVWEKTRRTLLAFLVCPTVGGIIYGLYGIAYDHVLKSVSIIDPKGFELILAFILPYLMATAIGAIIAWTLGAVVFGCLYAAHLEKVWTYALAGTLIGAGAGYFFTGKTFSNPGFILIFTGIGTACSTTFWLIRRGPRQATSPSQ